MSYCFLHNYYAFSFLTVEACSVLAVLMLGVNNSICVLKEYVDCPSIHKFYTFSLSRGRITDHGVVALAEVPIKTLRFLK